MAESAGDVELLPDTLEIVSINPQYGFEYKVALEDGRRMRGVARIEDMDVLEDASLDEFGGDDDAE